MQLFCNLHLFFTDLNNDSMNLSKLFLIKNKYSHHQVFKNAVPGFEIQFYAVFCKHLNVARIAYLLKTHIKVIDIAFFSVHKVNFSRAGNYFT